MAGSLTASVHHHRGNAVAAPEFSRWQISYARFVQFLSSPSSYPGLKPVGKRELYYPPYGTWLSTSSSNVSLQLVDELNRSDVILSVQLGGKLLEEHYISKLNFTWPQMSCVSGFPSRGSRAIFVSYKDSANEIQKFAVRFSTCDAALDFVVTLKEKLKGLEEAGNQRNETMCEVSFQSDYNPSNGRIRRATEEKPSMVKPLNSYVPEMQLPRLEYEAQNQKFETRSEVSFQSDYNPSDETVSRASAEEPNMGNLLDSYVPEMLPRLEYETRQTLYQPEFAISRVPNQSSNNLPPSFTTLLSGCFPNSTLDAGQTTVKQDSDLKSQILNYMEDSSFQDMLQKVERIMEEIGGNWIL
ncbi:PREDICTED: protein POOR HOMOLOGOUS SYNAPSIS 1-like isoform X1 [Camelina sativa]|uniref:Protein POOR HOMOLOGOUS SYNAPSIS 1-like isoform X1 n=1 Tax=Camelina sativa TaxID=90675 RepID=A0ABM0XW12_CAMSA|nr:PREDICTED: protein POOR HOMOLOGOUS SYNAPSIS 1-like isoform X1 [Camelina sativa]